MLVAFSGGPDSVALTRLLLEQGYKVHLAYVNYNLRGLESYQEERWVRAFAEEHSLPLDVLSLDGQALKGSNSLQVSARKLRYAWMESLLETHGIAWGVTAHTYDDFVETLVYQLLRGADLWMFKGIPFRRGRWLRPLLSVRRSEVIAFLRERGMEAYRLDSSNYEPGYLRNTIRWRVLSSFRQVHPEAARRMGERYEIYRLQRRRLEKLYRHLIGRYVKEEVFGGSIHSGLREDAFYWVLQEKIGLSWRKGREIYRLYRRGRVGAFRQVGNIVFCRVPTGMEWGEAFLWAPDWPDCLIIGPGTYEWGLWRLKVHREPLGEPPQVPLPVCLLPLRVRRWRRGDRIAPAGMNGHSKKLSDVWPELGLYGFRRRHAFVIEDQSGTIRYALAYRVDWQVPAMKGPFLYFSYEYVRRDPPIVKSS